MSCGWISAGASTRAEESWRKEQCHPHGGRNDDSPKKPSTAEHRANSQQQKEEVDKEEEEEGKMVKNKTLVSVELPIIKNPKQTQTWQLERTVLGSVLDLPSIYQLGWQDTC